MVTPRGRWPVESKDQFQTTCSQCHTHIATPSDTGPVICPRCKAMIDARDGQPYGIPRFFTPLIEAALNIPDSELVSWPEFDAVPLDSTIDPGMPDDEEIVTRQDTSLTEQTDAV